MSNENSFELSTNERIAFETAAQHTKLYGRLRPEQVVTGLSDIINVAILDALQAQESLIDPNFKNRQFNDGYDTAVIDMLNAGLGGS